MRPSNKSRSRNKPGNNGNTLHNPNNPNNQGNQRRSLGNIINRVFESAGPEGKVRGTPQQIIDKYQGLARDAQLAGDRVAGENFLQHAEHYSRLLGEAQREQDDQRSRMEREDRPRGEDIPERQHMQPTPQPMASGLTTIEPEDSEDLRGPIETPEGSLDHVPIQTVHGPQPLPLRVPVMNGEMHIAPSDAPVDPPVAAGGDLVPAKRGRPRRKPGDEPPHVVVQAD
jgi:hypothetical protein